MTALAEVPEPLPEGERVLWSGAPERRRFTRHALHLPLLAGYFAVLIGWYGVAALSDGAELGRVLVNAASFAAVACVPLGLIWAYGWGVARTTSYTVTDRRVVIQSGIALPRALNLPLVRIEAAATNARAGEVALRLGAGDRIAYPLLWPNARPWRLAPAEPALRGLPDAAHVARVLGRALAASAGMPAPVMEPEHAVRPATVVPA